MGTTRSVTRIAGMVLLLSGGNGDASDVESDRKPGPVAIQAQKVSRVGKGQSEIFRIGEDGTSLVNLTKHRGNDVSPVWSPDGKRILFQSDREGTWNIHVMDADGKNVTKVTETGGVDGAPTWSPDGGRIAFSRLEGNEAEIYTADISGGNLKRLTDSPGINVYPAWSPDGKTIAFVSDRDGESRGIYLMGADGANPRKVIPHASHPAWSPDGKRLTYCAWDKAHRNPPPAFRVGRRWRERQAVGRHSPRLQQPVLVPGREVRCLCRGGRRRAGDRRGKRRIPRHRPERAGRGVSPLASGVTGLRNSCRVLS